MDDILLLPTTKYTLKPRQLIPLKHPAAFPGESETSHPGIVSRAAYGNSMEPPGVSDEGCDVDYFQPSYWLKKFCASAKNAEKSFSDASHLRFHDSINYSDYALIIEMVVARGRKISSRGQNQQKKYTRKIKTIVYVQEKHKYLYTQTVESKMEREISNLIYSRFCFREGNRNIFCHGIRHADR